MPATKKKATASTYKFLKSSSKVFWNQLGIFPDAVKALISGNAAKTDSKKKLAKLGQGNLRMLCEQSKIACAEGLSETRLAESLLANSDPSTLLHLLEFSKRKTEWIDKVYEEKVSSRKRTGIQASVRQLGKSSAETVKTLTKLLILYCLHPKSLMDIFIYDTWYRRSTFFEYAIESNNANTFDKLFTKNIKQLVARFKKITRLGVAHLATHTLPNGHTVWVLLREYATRVKRDYKSQYNISHDCGLIVLGYNTDEQRLHFRGANKQLEIALREYLTVDLSLQVELLQNQVYSDYDPERVRTALVGGYPEEHGIDITEVSFARSGLPGSGPVALKHGFMQRSVKADLELLSHDQHGVLDIRGPSDIESMAVSFRGCNAQITPEILKGGAVRFVLPQSELEFSCVNVSITRNAGEFDERHLSRLWKT